MSNNQSPKSPFPVEPAKSRGKESSGARSASFLMPVSLLPDGYGEFGGSYGEPWCERKVGRRRGGVVIHFLFLKEKKMLDRETLTRKRKKKPLGKDQGRERETWQSLDTNTLVKYPIIQAT